MAYNPATNQHETPLPYPLVHIDTLDTLTGYNLRVPMIDGAVQLGANEVKPNGYVTVAKLEGGDTIVYNPDGSPLQAELQIGDTRRPAFTEPVDNIRFVRRDENGQEQWFIAGPPSEQVGNLGVVDALGIIIGFYATEKRRKQAQHSN